MNGRKEQLEHSAFCDELRICVSEIITSLISIPSNEIKFVRYKINRAYWRSGKMFIDIVDTRDMDEHTGGRKRKVQDDR